MSSGIGIVLFFVKAFLAGVCFGHDGWTRLRVGGVCQCEDIGFTGDLTSSEASCFHEGGALAFLQLGC